MRKVNVISAALTFLKPCAFRDYFGTEKKKRKRKKVACSIIFVFFDCLSTSFSLLMLLGFSSVGRCCAVLG